MEPAVVSRPEEGTVAERSNNKIRVKRLGALIREGDDTLFAALGVKDADAPLVEIEIGNVDADQLRATDACIEQDHEHRLVSQTDLRPHIAGGEEREHLFSRERLNDLLRHPYITKRREWCALQIVGKDEPVEETTHLAEVAVTRGRGVVCVAPQVSVEVGRLDVADILRESFVMADSEETTQRLSVRADGSR